MIILFSGTGNTARVASLLSGQLCESILRIDGDNAIEMCQERRVIWCFPIYSWGLPQIVREAICTLDAPAGVRHYMVCTCGDDIGDAHLQWRRAIRSRGWDAVSAYSVQMPNTYVSLPGFDVDSPEVERHKLDAAPTRVAAIAEAIRCGNVADDVVRGGMPRIKSRVLYPLFMNCMRGTGAFRADERCIGCGKCAANCPSKMIEMNDGRPHWRKGKCQMCLRCYHQCPARAIDYGRATRGKGQYHL